MNEQLCDNINYRINIRRVIFLKGVKGSLLRAGLNFLHCVRNVLMSELCPETDYGFPWFFLVPPYKFRVNKLNSNLNQTASSSNVPLQHSVTSHQLTHLARCTDSATLECSLRVGEYYRTIQIDLPCCESVDSHRDLL